MPLLRSALRLAFSTNGRILQEGQAPVRDIQFCAHQSKAPALRSDQERWASRK